MLIGADFVYEWINRATSLTEHYTDAGVLPRALMPARRPPIGTATISPLRRCDVPGHSVDCGVPLRRNADGRLPNSVGDDRDLILHLAVIERYAGDHGRRR